MMNSKTKRPKRVRRSTRRMTLWLRLRRSWTRFQTNRVTRRLAKERNRLALIQQMLDQQLLLLSWLELSEQERGFQLAEQEASMVYRRTGLVVDSQEPNPLPSLLTGPTPPQT